MSWQIRVVDAVTEGFTELGNLRAQAAKYEQLTGSPLHPGQPR